MKLNGTSVRDRLMAAIALHKQENPGLPIAVSELCRMAGVNRANVYAHHSDLLRELRAMPNADRARESKMIASGKDPELELKSLRQQNKALIYLCLELQLSIEDLSKRHLGHSTGRRNQK